MREILFRGKNVSTKEWVEGLLFFSHGTGIYKITYSNGWTPSYNNPDEGESTIYSEVIPETIGQYTGLKDKNGTKIFENDIVKWGHVAGGLEYPIRVARVDLFPSLQFEIIQNRKQFFKRTFEYGSFMYQNTEKYLEVIGNLHDNPELLKGE